MGDVTTMARPMWGHVAMAWPPHQPPDIFMGDVAPMNIIPYIRRCHITDEYVALCSSVIYSLVGSINRQI
jgi:hypothetical protein